MGRLHQRFLWVGLCAGVVGSALVGAGCGSDASGDDGSSQQGQASAGGKYRGVVSGASFTGLLEVDLGEGGASSTAKSRDSGVSGTLSMLTGGTPIAITGTWDSASGALTLSGGGFTFDGKVDQKGISGTYQSPAGDGAFTLLAASEATISLFCGTFSGAGSGTWNVAAAEGGGASGAFANADGSSAGTFSGTWSNGKLSLSGSEVTASGSLTEQGGTGSWQAGANQGTWSGSSCGGSLEDTDSDASSGTSPDISSDAGTGTQPGDGDQSPGDGPTVKGEGIAPGSCLPLDNGSCTDPSHPYSYLCVNSAVTPEADCVGDAAAKCCAHPYCVRQPGSEYRCEGAGLPAWSFMCFADAPVPSSCVANSSGGTIQYCCP